MSGAADGRAPGRRAGPLARLDNERYWLGIHRLLERDAAQQQAKLTQLRQRNIPQAERRVTEAQAQLAALPAGLLLVKRAAQAALARQECEAHELGQLERHRRRQQYGGYYLRVEIPA